MAIIYLTNPLFLARPFHLFRYLDEQAFRFNARKTDDGSRFLAALRTIVGRRLTYKSLIGQDGPAMATTPAQRETTKWATLSRLASRRQMSDS